MFIPPKRKKILEIFSKEPFRELHVREISRLSKVSLCNVDASIRLFLENNAVLIRKISNMKFVKPNMGNEILLKMFEFIELEKRFEFYRKNKKFARLLKKYTDNIVASSKMKIQTVILFGSVARGEWTRKSDVDLLVVTSDKEDINSVLKRSQKEAGALLRISPITTTIEKFVEGFSKKTEFYEELFKDRVVLYNEFIFWRLIKQGGEFYA